MVLSDFCEKIKISRRRWPGYCGIAQNLDLVYIIIRFFCLKRRYMWISDIANIKNCREPPPSSWRRVEAMAMVPRPWQRVVLVAGLVTALNILMFLLTPDTPGTVREKFRSD